TIIHLSDIHFGRIDRKTIGPLIASVHLSRPDLVVVSGDLTQWARRNEFSAARDFLHSLPGPQIVVPGNHDLPVLNPVARLARPLARYKHFITANLHPMFEDEEIAAIGINTARAHTTKYGRISKSQLAIVREQLCPIPNDRIKILVTHHPFDLPEGYQDTRQLVNRAGRAMKILAECGVDLLLAGHLHRVFTRDTAERYKISGYAALVVQAGTATSWRASREVNSFNIIMTNGKSIAVRRMAWEPNAQMFIASAEDHFVHTENGWSKASAGITPVRPSVLR